ncbi:MAG: hypothetical protein ACC700_17495 [Anaerolineales bacterium]
MLRSQFALPQLPVLGSSWRLATFAALAIVVAAAACQVGPAQPPTKGPFPLEGVDQLTSDLAYYRDLSWSPDGNMIAARKCGIVNRQAQCSSTEESLVLIELDSGAQEQVTVSLEDAQSIGGYPIDWSGDGRNLILAIGRLASSGESSVKFHTYSYGSYSLSSNEFSELPADQFPIGWSQSGTEILIELIGADGTFSLGWLDLQNQILTDVPLQPPSGGFLGPLILSPDGRTLLESDSHLPESCSEIRVGPLESQEDLLPFLSLACFPAWSRDGSKLVYAAKDQPRSTPNQIMIANSDGSDPRPLFPDRPVGDLGFPTWSPDGARIAFAQGPDGGNAIYIVDVPEELQP